MITRQVDSGSGHQGGQFRYKVQWLEGEDIEVLELSFDRAFAMISSGEICDGKTIMLLQYAALNIFVSSPI